MEIPDINFVLRSKIRIQVLKILNKEGPRTTSVLSKKIKSDIANTKRIIISLQDKEIIKCLNPEDFHFKQYEITLKGKNILEEIQSFS